MAEKHIDEPTGVETVGHEWDGIEELNNPLPRWWLITLYLTIAFSIGYVLVYPAIPLLNKGTEGVWGWTSRGALADELTAERAQHAPVIAALKNLPIEQLPQHPALMRDAIAGGRAAFRVNCVQCHGSGAAGGAGYPNLNDDDWLWGGNLKEIEFTLTHGIRQPGHDATRISQMPNFGPSANGDGILTVTQIADVVSHVRTLSGKEAASPASARGTAIFAANCVVCHGNEGKGLRQFGAPNLSDAIWLYGSSREKITRSVNAAHYGVMPAWGSRLDPATIKMLAAYVHSLGGGEDFVTTAPAPSPLASNANP